MQPTITAIVDAACAATWAALILCMPRRLPMRFDAATPILVNTMISWQLWVFLKVPWLTQME
jgi:hypothetical protein